MNIEKLYQIYLVSTGISTDSRKSYPGSLFFALKGETFDGNKFAGIALSKGSSFAIVDDESLHGLDKHIYVKNVLKTMQELAKLHRRQLNIPILAITGSNGKTTTKELCLSILSKKFKVSGTKGNLNNHIGVPISIL